SGSTSIISASQFCSRAFACITSSTNQPGSKRARYRLSLENAPAIKPTPRRTKDVVGVWIFYVESRARTRGKRIVPSWKTSTAGRRGARRWRLKSYHKREHEADRAKRCESAYSYRR